MAAASEEERRKMRQQRGADSWQGIYRHLIANKERAEARLHAGEVGLQARNNGATATDALEAVESGFDVGDWSIEDRSRRQ
ncbi:hypothetical protein BHE74_00031315 [Ensete ventricosum]|nr:hypothetical protein GW17_00035578 [Ensete ventricosum]RWW61617.1 hypothetical protein BHE74_00031315 [Ensete ventricosum]RZS04907.1 hypothetical protein BHM03_00035307 [Ensete ventricosum]